LNRNVTDSGNPLSLVLAAVVVIAVLLLGGFGSCAAYNQIRVYNAQQAGRAVLAEAQSSRQVKTLEAKAAKESAKSYADAEIIRARGAAEANRIIANGLGGPEGYLEYLKIEAMKESKNQIVYVPTEAGLPITESGRLVARPAAN
jgi:regulator of protease activity HflC (stomatin/prohibitin superfamily)